jgi:hypothetical protein
MPKRVDEQLRLIPCELEDQFLTEEEEGDRAPQVEGIKTEADFISFVIDLRDDYLEYSSDLFRAGLHQIASQPGKAFSK